MARMVEAQSRWSMGKTALISSLVSFSLGSALEVSFLNTTAIGMLIGFWFFLFMPVMLVVSAIMSANKDAGHFIIYLMASSGIWFLGGFLTIIAAAIF